MRWSVPPSTPPAPALPALRGRFPALADPDATPLPERFAHGEILRADGRAWSADELAGPGDQLWFHRELRAERVDPVDLRILHHDEHLLILDKPHDMATMPRGAHIRSSALVRLRRATGITTLTPLHRLDRRTAGVLALGIRPEERPTYQQLFARGEVRKEYLARVQLAGGATIPRTVGERSVLRDRLHKQQGVLTSSVVEGEPNAITDLEVLAVGADGTLTLWLGPRTGRTHQLRAQLSSRGAPIVGEDLYPRPRLIADGGEHLQLLARSLSFADPVTGAQRRFVTRSDLGDGSPSRILEP